MSGTLVNLFGLWWGNSALAVSWVTGQLLSYNILAQFFHFATRMYYYSLLGTTCE
jgi:hypothetical protein